MELKEIRKIVELMNEHGLSYFHLEQEGVNVKLKKGLDAEAIRDAFGSMPQYSAGPAPAPAPAASAPAAPASASDAPPAASGEEITSPMVGTFYRKPAPDSPTFVEVGTAVSEGQTLCIIEAMKVMNEIKAEKSGTITEICVDDATPVQFGDVLFRIQ
ncbi:MAG: acetyl-CoA carboxylase biotin carboxyl carrier protein [Verrucomicrobiota bacterium JB023]|nr:acetyl-CoA carboxylase biotin carboxyl carrier protein [Verrucomicrobiota bacterium JB023]